MWGCLAIVAVAGACGRIGFDPSGAGDGAAVDPDGADAGGDPSLIAWWRMEDDPADGVRDSSGNGHHGTCTACPVQTGSAIPALLFDGVDDEVTVVASPALAPPQFTIAAHVRPRVLHAGPLVTMDGEYEVALGPGGEVSFGSVAVFPTAPVYAAGTWLHIAVTHDATPTVWVDGVARLDIPADATFMPQPVRLGGGQFGGTPRWLDGELWDVRLYDRILSRAEVEALAAMR